MSKMAIPGRTGKKDSNGNRVGAKATGHGTFRCKRHPNAKRCKNGTVR